MIDPAPAILSAGTAAAIRPGAGAATGFSGELEQARQAAVELVSTAFIVPVLEAMRESPFQAEPFAPNFAQKRFAPLLDERIADRIATSANFGLVDAIVDRLTRSPATLRTLRQEVLDAQG